MRTLRSALAYAALLLTAAIGCATLLALLPLDWWVAEVLRHPRPHYVLALLLCLASLVRRWPRAGWLTLLPLAVHVAALLPLLLPAGAAAPGARQVTIIHYNLDRDAPDHTAAFAYLRATAPDLLSLQELTPALAARLSTELPDYRVVDSRALSNSHGSALLVRRSAGLNVRSTGFISLPAYSPRPLLTAELDLDGVTVALINFHVIRPLRDWDAAFQRIEFAEAARWSRERQAAGRAVLLIGDLNTTGWSRGFAQLAADGNLQDSERGHGLQATWPGWLPQQLGIPIDHCLHSADLAIAARRAGPFHAGDHAPLLVTFARAAQ